MAVGALTLASTYALSTGAKPYGMAAYGNNLYVMDNTSGASLLFQLAVDPSTGALSQISGKSLSLAAGSLSRWVAVSPDGKHVYGVSSGGSDIYIFTRSATDGSLTFYGKLSDPSSNMAVPNGIAISPDNNHVYVTCRDSGRIIQLQRDTTTGALSFLSNPYVNTTGTNANCQGIAVTPDGTGVYAVSANSVYCYTRDPVTGLLVAASTPSVATSSAFPDAIAISDDNNFVYVAADSGNQFTDCFPRNTATNNLGTKLTPPGNTSDNNGGPWGVALSKDVGNTSVYLAVSDVQKITQYNRNGSTGALTFKTPGSVTTSNRGLASPQGGSGAGPYNVVVKPDNKFLFASALGTASIDVFSIEQEAAPAATVTSVSVTPANPTVQGGATQQFSATVTGTNSPAQTVTWSKTGAGSINASGLYTAPAATASAQTATITATSTVDGTKSGSATVTIPAQAPAVTHTATVTLGNASGAIANRSGLVAHVFSTANMGTANATDATGKLTLDVTSMGITGTAYVAVVDPATGEHWAGQVTVI